MPKTKHVFTQDAFDAICDRLAGGESLRGICEGTEGHPSISTIIRWIEGDAALAKQYARARELQADHEFDEIKAIVDGATPEDVQVARLRMDARKWRAGKMRPKVYGDKLDLSGDIGFTVTIAGDDAKL